MGGSRSDRWQGRYVERDGILIDALGCGPVVGKHWQVHRPRFRGSTGAIMTIPRAFSPLRASAPLPPAWQAADDSDPASGGTNVVTAHALLPFRRLQEHPLAPRRVRRHAARRRRIRAVKTTGAFLLGAALLLGAGRAAMGGDTDPSARIRATFANFPRFDPPVPDLELLPCAPPSGIPPSIAFLLDEKRRAYDAQRATVLELRNKLNRDALAAVTASLHLLRTSSGYWSTYFGSRMRAESRYCWRELEYLLTLKSLHDAQARLHAIAQQYYGQPFALLFAACTRQQREEVLRRFQERWRTLREKRREAFTQIEEQRANFWCDPERRRLEERVGRADDPPALALARLQEAELQWRYAWLMPESSVHLAILGRLLEGHARALAAQELHPAVVAAVASDPKFRPTGSLPEAGMEIRVEILRARAQRALVHECLREMQLEASHRTRVSLLLGVWGSVKGAGEKYWQAWSEKTVTREGFEGLELPTKLLATAAISYKLLGDLWSATVTTPLKDAILSRVKAALGASGASIRDSTQEAWEECKRQQEEISRRIGFLGKIAASCSVAEARAFIAYFRNDNAGVAHQLAGFAASVKLEEKDAQAIRSLLGDADFIAATEGGLPVLFAAVALTPEDEVALHLRAAQYEMRADFEAALRRIAAFRGRTLSPDDWAETRKALDAALGPPTMLWNRREFYPQRDSVLCCVPVLGPAVKTLWDLPRITALIGEELKGNLAGEDRYAEQMAGLSKSLSRLMVNLALAKFNFGELLRARPDSRREHALLLGGSHEYALAWARLRESEAERWKLRAQARQSAAGTLTPRGQGALATEHALLDVEATTLRARAAWYKLAYFAQTRDYGAAAEQVAQLGLVEEQRRRARGIVPAKVDLSWAEQAFRREVLASELIVAYEELYRATLREVVVSAAGNALKNTLVGARGPVGAGLATDLALSPEEFGDKLIGAINPWAGKLSGKAIVDTVTGAAQDAFVSAAAQKLAEATSRLTREEIETLLSWSLDIFHPTLEEIGSRMKESAVRWYAPYRERRQREEQLRQAEADLRAYEEEHLAPLRRQLQGLGDSEEEEAQRSALILRMIALDGAPAAVGLRASLAAAAADLEGARGRHVESQEELAQLSGLLAVGLAEARATEEASGASPADADKARRIGTDLTVLDYLRTLTRGFASSDDLRRLVDPSDPLRLKERIFEPGLGLPVLRSALLAAVAQDPSQAPRIKEVAVELERARVQRLKSLMEEFVRESPAGGQVLAITHDGPGEGDVEQGGLSGDVTLTVRAKEGADQAAIDKALREFLAMRRHPIDGPGALVSSIQVRLPAARAREAGGRPARAGVWSGETLPDEPPAGPGPKKLGSKAAKVIEEQQGFRAEHAQNMYLFAQRTGTFLVVRGANPESVRHHSDPDAVPKEMSCKAKTMHLGAESGLVVNPTHPRQAAAWEEAIRAARAARNERLAASLESEKAAAVKAWQKYSPEMLDEKKAQYRVDPQTGVVLMRVNIVRDGVPVVEYRKVHGDYDLHGVYRMTAAGCVRVDMGSGSGEPTAAQAALRDQLNRLVAGTGTKKMFLHGGQDDWEMPGKKPEPPVTIFFPDGRPPMQLKTAEEMRRFYEGEMKIRWEYDETLGAGEARFREHVYCTAPGQAYAYNLAAGCGGRLAGAGAADVQPVDRGWAPLLVLDIARQMSFLTDPRFEPAALAALPSDEERQRCLAEALASSELFLQLVDAHLLGISATPREPARGTSGYYAAMAKEMEALVGANRARGLTPEDLASVRRLLEIRAKGIAPPVAETLALLDWMRARSVEIVAQTAPRWQEAYEEGCRAFLREAARVAHINDSSAGSAFVPLLVSPFVPLGSSLRPYGVDAYRDALLRAMAESRRLRAALARAQAAARAQSLSQHGGAPLDAAARQAIQSGLAGGLASTRDAEALAALLETSRWDMAAELSGT